MSVFKKNSNAIWGNLFAAKLAAITAAHGQYPTFVYETVCPCL